MKKLNLVLIMVVATVFLTVSCSKEDDSGSSPVTGNSLKADIDGSTWEAPAVNAIIESATLSVVGAKQGGSSIIIAMPEDVSTGTYDLSIIGNHSAIYNKTEAEPYLSSDGKLIITKHDLAAKKIEGSFNFNGQGLDPTAKVAITNGSFSTTYN